MRKAIYAGSFDPFTFGHLSVAINAARVFDEVTVLISFNERKKYMFSVEERMELINAAVRDFHGIKVDHYDGYVVAYANKHGCDFLVRGIRGESDIASELGLANLNSALSPTVQTIFIPADPILSNVSSSELKRKLDSGEDIRPYAPTEVIRAMKSKREK